MINSDTERLIDVGIADEAILLLTERDVTKTEVTLPDVTTNSDTTDNNVTEEDIQVTADPVT